MCSAGAPHNSQSRGTGRGTTGGCQARPAARPSSVASDWPWSYLRPLQLQRPDCRARTSISHRLWQREISPHRCPCCLGRPSGGQRNADLFLWLRAPRRAALGRRRARRTTAQSWWRRGGAFRRSRFFTRKGIASALSGRRGPFWTAGTGADSGARLLRREAPCRMPEAQLEPVAFARIATVHCSRSIFGESRPSFRKSRGCNAADAGLSEHPRSTLGGGASSDRAATC